MISQNKLNFLCQNVINHIEINENNLKSWHFNEEDIKELIEKHILTKNDDATYSFIGVDLLCNYAFSFIQKNNYEVASLIYKRCLEINPNYKEANLRLLINALQTKNFDQAFHFLEVLHNQMTSLNNSNYNFYLYLFYQLMDLPKDYKVYAESLTWDDLKVPENRFNKENAENAIRQLAFNNNFIIAFEQLNDVGHAKEKLSVHQLIVKHLLYNIIETRIKIRTFLTEKVKNKDYKSINNILNYYPIRFFNETDYYVLIVASDILNILRTKEIPHINNFKTKHTSNAIDSKNFQLALELCESNLENLQTTKEDNPLYLILIDINELITSLKNKQIEKNDYKINEAYRYLKDGNTLGAFKILREYLVILGKKEYIFLIFAFLKLSIIENDEDLSKFKSIIKALQENNLVIDINYFINLLNTSVEEENYKKAGIILDIINEVNELNLDKKVNNELTLTLKPNHID